jgi:hypothetical protein
MPGFENGTGERRDHKVGRAHNNKIIKENTNTSYGTAVLFKLQTLLLQNENYS